MPRQPIAYTVPQPLEPLNIEEVKFWLHIMQEHALFIKAGLPCEDTALIDEAQAFYQEFEALLNQAERIKSIKQNNEFINSVYEAVKEFYCYKRELLKAKLACRLGGTNFPLLLDHMSREAEYFLRLLDKIRNGRVALKESSKTQETVFWLRDMADHAKFISHLLDPSERNLINMARDFSCQFDNLVLQGRDFASMLHCHEGEVMAFRRFLMDVKADVQRLRDFKKAAEDLIAECRLLGIIPELLASHLRREAEHFLMILAMMERGLMKHTAAYCMEDVPCIDDEYIGKVKAGSAMEEIESDEDEDEKPPFIHGAMGYKKPKYSFSPTVMEDKCEAAEECFVPQSQPPVVEECFAPVEDCCPPVVDECPPIDDCCSVPVMDIGTETAEAEEEMEMPGHCPEQAEEALVQEPAKPFAKASDYKIKPHHGMPTANHEAFQKPYTENNTVVARPEATGKYKWGGKFPRRLGK